VCRGWQTGRKLERTFTSATLVAMRPKTRRLVLFSVLALAAYAVGVVADADGLRRYLALGDDIEALELKNARLRGEIDGLRRQLASLGADRRALERSARDEFGYVRSGEWQFRIED